MKIQVNGEPHDLPEGCTVEQLMVVLGLAGKRVAMEINRELVPRSIHSTHRLQDGDHVEIVQAIGGG